MKVLVALSGGPKSTVTAWLLKKQGFQVRGIHFDLSEGGSASGRMVDLERKLGFPIQVIPARESLVRLPSTPGRRLRSLFHSDVLLPNLFEAARQYKTERVAGGYAVTLQEDPSAGLTRVFLGSGASIDAILLFRGLGQIELSTLMLPVGSIPSSMLQKLSDEVAPPEQTSSFETDWRALEASIRSSGSASEESGRFFKVLNSSNQVLGEAPSNQIESGGVWRDSGKPGRVYRVNAVFRGNSTIEVVEDPDAVYRELHLEDAYWFVRADPRLSEVKTELYFEGIDRAVPIRLIQFEGRRIKALPLEPISVAAVNLEKGQEVLWMEGAQVIGGARVMVMK